MKKMFKSSLRKIASIVLAVATLGLSTNPSYADGPNLCGRGKMKVTYINTTAGVLIAPIGSAVSIIGYAISTAASGSDQLVVLATNIIQAVPAVGSVASAMLVGPRLMASSQAANLGFDSSKNSFFFPFPVDTGAFRSTQAAGSTPNGAVGTISSNGTPGWVYSCVE